MCFHKGQQGGFYTSVTHVVTLNLSLDSYLNSRGGLDAKQHSDLVSLSSCQLCVEAREVIWRNSVVVVALFNPPSTFL